MGTLLGAAGGAALGLGAFALSQQNFTPTTTMAAVIGGGLLLGAAASGWRKDVGAGIAGGAGAIAATYGASMLYTKQASSNTQTGRMGAVRQLPLAAGGSHAQMNAVQAPIGRRRKLVMSGMGAVEAPIAPGVKARLSGLA